MFPIQSVKNCSKEYKLIKSIGKGSFGEVFIVQNKVTNSKVAGKFIKINRYSSEERIRKEIVILASLHHDNLVEYISSYSSPKVYIIMTKYYSGKSLYHRRRNENITERDVTLYVSQICKALMYMHEKCIIHRDIKSTNILFETKDGNHIRIIDFGLSCELEDENITVKCGTRTYFAPEVIRSEQITGATDMWSLGVLTYWLLSLTYPFPTCSEQLSLIEGGQYTYNAQFEVVSGTARNFIDNLLIVQPLLRMTASSALQHSWLSLALNNEPTSKSD